MLLVRSIAILVCAALLAFTVPTGIAGAGGPVWVTPAVTAPGVTRQLFNSAAVGAPVSYHIYRPPAYNAQPQRHFPVLYWLHGAGSVLAGIATVSGMFDAAIAAGRIPPLLVVLPNGPEYGMWCNAESGLQPVESMLVDDLLPAVDAHFRTLPQERARLVEGFSMGGYGAARLALLYPDRFGAASMLGAGPLQLDFLVDDPNLNPIALRRRILAEVYGNSAAVFEERSPWVSAELLPPAPGYRWRQLILKSRTQRVQVVVPSAPPAESETLNAILRSRHPHDQPLLGGQSTRQHVGIGCRQAFKTVDVGDLHPAPAVIGGRCHEGRRLG